MSKKNWAKHDEERDRLMAMVPPTLPPEVDDWIENYCLNDHQYIFYDKKEHYAYCTRCHRELNGRFLMANQAAHNRDARCSFCNGRAQFKCIGRFKKTNMIMDEFQFSILQRTDEGIMLRRFEVRKHILKDRYRGHWVEIRMEWCELQRVFNDSMIVKNYRSLWDYKTQSEYWNESKKFEFAVKQLMGGYQVIKEHCEYLANVPEVIAGTPFQYAAFRMPEKLAAWIRTVEYLEKCGWTELAKNILQHDTRWLNLKATSLDKMLRLPKYAVKYAREGNYGIDHLQTLHELIKQGVKLPDDPRLVIKFGNEKCYYDEARKIAHAITLQDWLNWLKHRSHDAMYQYIDYLRMCSQLGYNLASHDVIYPKNIRQAHDREMARVKYKENKKFEKSIQNRYVEDMDRLAYQSDNLIIRPPQDVKELLQEGSALSHCVGTYADRVAKRQTTILFIRRLDHPEDPFYTLEYRDSKIIQCRGLKNCDTTKEVNEFLKIWISAIKKRKPAAVSAT
jgi:hypothetical protein